MKIYIESVRWLGRLTSVLLILAKNKGIRFNNNPQLIELITSVLNQSIGNEEYIINTLLKKFEDATSNEKTKSITFTNSDIAQQKNKGMSDVDYIYNKYHCINEKVLIEEDFALLYSQEIENERQKRKANIQNKIKIILSISVTILLGILIYNLEYFREIRKYNDVIEDQMTYICQEYYREFPDGKHYEDVMLIESNIDYSPIYIVTSYLNKFPNGKYIFEMNQKYDSLWNEKIDTYKNLDKVGQDPKAVKYMLAMLEHMKKEHLTTIILKISPKIDLKDYEEYDENVRMLLELLASEETLPLNTNNIISLKENFSNSDKNQLYSILSESIETYFENIFTSDFVNIIMNDNTNKNDKSPIINCNYIIKNSNETLSSKYEVPNIWTYTSNGVAKSYILGIDINFNVNMSIPGTSNSYSYSEVGNPGENISNIADIKDGYRKMTQACFYEFRRKLLSNIGLNNN